MQKFNQSDSPYVVLIGHVGTGKSTIVEKLTNERNRSGSSSKSVTTSSEVFWTFDGRMVICDTPGTNPEADKFTHNVQIAAALNFKPVSRLLIVVKAETRMANPLDRIREFASDLIDLPDEVVGAVVTHMDTVSWFPQELRTCVREELGIDCLIFSGTHVSKQTLLNEIKASCTQTFNLRIDHGNFLKLFKIGKTKRNIIRQIRDEVEAFTDIKNQFREGRKIYKGKDEIDLIFEFQAWMGDLIELAQKRISEANGFTFYGKEAESEAGYIANMTNQMRLVLYDLRLEAAGFQSAHGAGDARRCIYCNEVWIKVEGCDGATTCGSRPSQKPADVRSPEFSVLGTYSFRWTNKKLAISKHGNRHIQHKHYNAKIGCGRSINWSQMPKVPLPADLVRVIKPVRMDEVPILSSAVPGASNWHNAVDNELDNALKGLQLGKKPGGH